MSRTIGKWVATALCIVLLFFVATMSRHFRGGTDVKADVPGAVGEVGGHLPDFTLPDIDGNPVTLSQVNRKGPVLLTFDRSLDW
jgi:cytochrome oxidase Cu insertion factor (SCO1/SenC/PrrC family)